MIRVLSVISIVAAFASGLMYAQNIKTSTVLDSLVQDGYVVDRVIIDDTNGKATIYLERARTDYE